MQNTEELLDLWNIQKKNIEFTSVIKKMPIVWEFWWYFEWVNIGSEISKNWKFMRPCLVLKNDTWNWLVLVAPITSKWYEWMQKWYIEIHNYERYWLVSLRILLNQIKLIDRKRFIQKTSSFRPNKSFTHYVLEQYIKFLQ